MSISSEVRKAGPYDGNGVTVAFPFAFKVFAAGDLLITLADPDGAETELVLTTNYTVALNADQEVSPGGTVTALVAPATDYTLTISSQVENLQPISITNGGGFYPTVLNTALDRLTIMVQQISEKASRSLKLPVSAPAGMDTTLPVPVPYQLIGWNADGTGFQNTDSTYSTALATDLASTASGKGAALVGRNSQVVGSITALRALLKTSAAQHAFVTGYYTQGDGGGGEYYYDSTDTTSTDNGGTIIVASDGGRWKLTQSKNITVRQFGAKGDGVTDDSAKIQAAFDWLSTTGGLLWITSGVYVVTTPIKTYSYITVRGDGDTSQILVSTDIEVFYSDRTTVSTLIFKAEFYDIYIKKTFTGATTKYDIHLQNPNFCKLSNVHVQSGHDDSVYSATNVGGVFFDRPPTSTASAFCNLIENCWIQNNSIYFLGITDSSIQGGWIWGHVRQFAIRISGANSGNIDITGMNGIIPSRYNGGIWLDGAGINQIRIVDNEWDGNPLLILGSGIYCPQSTYAVTVANNTFWGCGTYGITTTDPAGWTITGNTFWKCNGQDGSYDDIRIIGATFSPNGNTVSDNAHIMDVARTNKGYAIREFNSGANPTGNTYSGNGIFGATGYINPAILTLASSAMVGNVGMGSDSILRLMGDSVKVDSNALWLSANGTLAATSGTLDMAVNIDSFSGSPGGFSGILSVSVTRPDFIEQSRRATYAVMGYGSTATFTQLGIQDGLGGGPTFTLSMAGNGVVRLTNTFASAVRGYLTFNGTKGLA